MIATLSQGFDGQGGGAPARDHRVALSQGLAEGLPRESLGEAPQLILGLASLAVDPVEGIP